MSVQSDLSVCNVLNGELVKQVQDDLVALLGEDFFHLDLVGSQSCLLLVFIVLLVV